MKFKEFIDDYIIWYCYDKPRDIYKSIRCWCRLCLKKRHWNIVKKAILGYPFDNYYLYDIEYAKICEMYDYFLHSDIVHPDPKNHDIVRTLRWCKRMMEIFMKDDHWHTEGSIDFEYTTKTDIKIICDVKVNTRNARRYICEDLYPFYKYNDTTSYDEYIEGRVKNLNKYPAELYRLKAKVLYHRLRMKCEEYWWD